MKIDNREISFSRIKLRDVLRIKEAMLSNIDNEKQAIIEINKIIDDILFDYLLVDKNPTNEKEFELLFQNQFVIIDIAQAFFNQIQGFLSSLQSYQKQEKLTKINK